MGLDRMQNLGTRMIVRTCLNEAKPHASLGYNCLGLRDRGARISIALRKTIHGKVPFVAGSAADRSVEITHRVRVRNHGKESQATIPESSEQQPRHGIYRVGS